MKNQAVDAIFSDPSHPRKYRRVHPTLALLSPGALDALPNGFLDSGERCSGAPGTCGPSGGARQVGFVHQAHLNAFVPPASRDWLACARREKTGVQGGAQRMGAESIL